MTHLCSQLIMASSSPAGSPRAQSTFLLIFVLIHSSVAYEACGDVELFSFGKALRTDFLGNYTLDQEDADGGRGSFHSVAGAPYHLWWSHFRGSVSRWSIGRILGDDASVMAYKDSHALHPSEIARQSHQKAWRVRATDASEWTDDASLHVKW